MAVDCSTLSTQGKLPLQYTVCSRLTGPVICLQHNKKQRHQLNMNVICIYENSSLKN